MKLNSRGYLKVGWDSLRSSKLRSFWTMLGIIIGVVSVITVVGIGEGVKQQVGGQLRNLSKGLVTIRPEQLSADGSGRSNTELLSGLRVSSYLSPKDYTTVRHTKGVKQSAPLALASGKIEGVNGEYDDGFVVGTTSDLGDLIKLSIDSGAFLTEDDMGANTAVLGKHAADLLFDENVPLGRSFKFHGQEFIVRGILNQSHSNLFSQQVNINNAIFIPYDVAQQITKDTAPTYQIIANAGDDKQAKAVKAAIASNLNKSHGGKSNLSVQVGSQNLATSDYILDLLTRMIAGVAAISLLVGGIGIMNVMLVSVAERVHEIGIRKALGATNRQIMNQFLAESTVLSLAGGIIGIIVSLGAAALLGVFTDLKPVIKPEVVIAATLVSLLVGIIFGTAPALKAARKDPIEALRAE